MEVNLKNNFNEFFINKKVISQSFGVDNVTKGQNLRKYAPITLHTRQYIFLKNLKIKCKKIIIIIL